MLLGRRTNHQSILLFYVHIDLVISEYCFTSIVPTVEIRLCIGDMDMVAGIYSTYKIFAFGVGILF